MFSLNYAIERTIKEGWTGVGLYFLLSPYLPLLTHCLPTVFSERRAFSAQYCRNHPPIFYIFLPSPSSRPSSPPAPHLHFQSLISPPSYSVCLPTSYSNIYTSSVFCCNEHKKKLTFIFNEAAYVTYEMAVPAAVLNTALMRIKNGYFLAKTGQFW